MRLRDHFLTSTALAGGLSLAMVSPSTADVVQDFRGAQYTSGAQARLETDAVHISLHRSASAELAGGLLVLDGQLVSVTGPHNLFLSLPNGGVEFQSGSQLASEGRVFMMARNGVLFQDGARIDVSSLVVTSSTMSQNALNRALRGDGVVFDEAARPGSVVENHGTITVAQGGFAALVAPTVRNSGSITARSGRIVLAGGTESFAIDPHGDGLIQFEVTSRTVAGGSASTGGAVASGTAAVEHSGFIQGGSVRITTGQMTNVLDRALSISGDVVAQSVRIDSNGDVVLGGANIDASGGANSVLGGGEVTITTTGHIAVTSSTIDASASQGDGGSVRIGDVGVTLSASSTTSISGAIATTHGDIRIASAEVDVSGASGGDVTITTTGHIAVTASTINASASAADGGEVRIGGDYQGTGELARANTLYVDADTRIEADAGQHGDGGKIILWSDGFTAFHGNILARGGELSGDGGFVEVSGKRWLGYRGLTDTRAAYGKTGTLLLDPTDITIVAALSGRGDRLGRNPRRRFPGCNEYGERRDPGNRPDHAIGHIECRGYDQLSGIHRGREHHRLDRY